EDDELSRFRERHRQRAQERQHGARKRHAVVRHQSERHVLHRGHLRLFAGARQIPPKRSRRRRWTVLPTRRQRRLLGYDFGPVILQGYVTSDVYEKNYGGKDVRGWARIILPLNVAGAPFGPPPPPITRKQ